MRNARMAILILLFSGIVFQGCSLIKSGPPTGEASSVYMNGTLSETFNGSVFKTFDAAAAALTDFNMTVTNSHKDASGGMIDAKRPDGTVAGIALRAQGSDTTVAGIRVGAAGDEELSRAIARRIEAHIKG